MQHAKVKKRHIVRNIFLSLLAVIIAVGSFYIISPAQANDLSHQITKGKDTPVDKVVKSQATSVIQKHLPKEVQNNGEVQVMMNKFNDIPMPEIQEKLKSDEGTKQLIDIISTRPISKENKENIVDAINNNTALSEIKEKISNGEWADAVSVAKNKLTQDEIEQLKDLF